MLSCFTNYIFEPDEELALLLNLLTEEDEWFVRMVREKVLNVVSQVRLNGEVHELEQSSSRFAGDELKDGDILHKFFLT